MTCVLASLFQYTEEFGIDETRRAFVLNESLICYFSPGDEGAGHYADVGAQPEAGLS